MKKYVKFTKECGQVDLTANKAYEVVSYKKKGIVEIVDDSGVKIYPRVGLPSAHLGGRESWIYCDAMKPTTLQRLTREADAILEQMKEITAKGSKSDALVAYFAGAEEMENRSRLAEEYVNKYEQKQEYFDELLKLRSGQIDHLISDCRDIANISHYWRKSAIWLYLIAFAEAIPLAWFFIHG